MNKKLKEVIKKAIERRKKLKVKPLSEKEIRESDKDFADAFGFLNENYSEDE